MTKTSWVGSKMSLRVLRHLAMDCINGPIEKLKMVTSDASKVASQAYVSSDPMDAKDILV